MYPIVKNGNTKTKQISKNTNKNKISGERKNKKNKILLDIVHILKLKKR